MKLGGTLDFTLKGFGSLKLFNIFPIQRDCQSCRGINSTPIPREHNLKGVSETIVD